MSQPVRPASLAVLVVEDNSVDAELVKALLQHQGPRRFMVDVVGRLDLALLRLMDQPPNVVLLDLSLPDAAGLQGLRQIRETRPDLPVVILSGTSDEETAVQAVSEGAQDYLVKGRIDPDLLARSLRYAVERQRLMVELREALARVKTLSGLLPICASCKNIRDDSGYWQAVDVYVQNHTDAAFSHALCPHCARALYPDLMGDWESPPRRNGLSGGAED
jgi:DNA-binding response OmpR family regulator